jgi:hypothetical protein
VGGEHAGGRKAGLGAEPLARLVEMGVDRVLGDAELARDLLGAQVLLHQTQAVPLAGCQKLNRQAFPPHSRIAGETYVFPLHLSTVR